MITSTQLANLDFGLKRFEAFRNLSGYKSRIYTKLFHRDYRMFKPAETSKFETGSRNPGLCKTEIYDLSYEKPRIVFRTYKTENPLSSISSSIPDKAISTLTMATSSLLSNITIRPKLSPSRASPIVSVPEKGVSHYLIGGGAALILAASLCISDPALAFKGGGPYGSQVTRGQDLTGKDFSGQTLIKQDFKTSILRQANFKGAKLLGASFFDADLTGADLSDADLRGIDMSLANFTKANLTNANLEGALTTGNTSFKGSIIDGADFTDVPLRDDQRAYLCKTAKGVNPTTGNATRETLFCE